MSQETRDLYARTLSTMTYGLDVLRDEADPDGALADLVHRIEADREWVRSLRVLGAEPSRPPDWLGGYPPAPPSQRLLTKERSCRKCEQDSNGSGPMMQKAAIDYRGGELQVWEQEDVWTVRLGELEASSRYLDLALAELLDDAEGAHKLAAKLLMELISTPAVTPTSDLVGAFAAGEARGEVARS
jgi:hypothetical protein